ANLSNREKLETREGEANLKEMEALRKQGEELRLAIMKERDHYRDECDELRDELQECRTRALFIKSEATQATARAEAFESEIYRLRARIDMIEKAPRPQLPPPGEKAGGASHDYGEPER